MRIKYWHRMKCILINWIFAFQTRWIFNRLYLIRQLIATFTQQSIRIHRYIEPNQPILSSLIMHRISIFRVIHFDVMVAVGYKYIHNNISALNGMDAVVLLIRHWKFYSENALKIISTTMNASLMRVNQFSILWLNWIEAVQ